MYKHTSHHIKSHTGRFYTAVTPTHNQTSCDTGAWYKAILRHMKTPLKQPTEPRFKSSIRAPSHSHTLFYTHTLLPQSYIALTAIHCSHSHTLLPQSYIAPTVIHCSHSHTLLPQSYIALIAIHCSHSHTLLS